MTSDTRAAREWIEGWDPNHLIDGTEDAAWVRDSLVDIDPETPTDEIPSVEVVADALREMREERTVSDRIVAGHMIRYDPRTGVIELQPEGELDEEDIEALRNNDNTVCEPLLGWGRYTHRIVSHDPVLGTTGNLLVEVAASG